MSEREWREAIDMRPSASGLAAVLVTAAVLRFWALPNGIPFAVGVDEPEIVGRAVQMMKSGDLNPHFFDYPGFYIYVQLAVACLHFIVGAMAGWWRTLDAVSPADFYLWGRAVTAALGVATVYLVFQIGVRWGARHALLGAALLAVMPNHVRESHFVLTDVPATFLVTLTFLLSLRALERGTFRAYAWAGATAGLAAATKYYGGVALLLPLLAAYMHRSGDRPRGRLALAALGAGAAAFLMGAPYTVLDLPGFLNGFAGVMGANRPGTSLWAGWYTAFKHLLIGLWWPGFLLALAGFGLGVVRAFTGPGHARFALAVALPAVYFPLVAGRGMIWARYLLPIVPIVSVLAAVAVVSGVSLLRRFSIPRWARTTLIIALTVAALLPPAVSSIRWVRMHGRTSTQAIAYAWIQSNLPANARVAIETRGILLPEDRFRVTHVRQLIDRDLAAYASDGFEYLIASSQAFGAGFEAPQLRPAEYAAYRRLFDEAVLAFTVAQSPEHPGPELRIYRVPR